MPARATAEGISACGSCRSDFAGLRPLQRHQLVYRSLGELMQTDIHALSITALTPEEAAPEEAGDAAAEKTHLRNQDSEPPGLPRLDTYISNTRALMTYFRTHSPTVLALARPAPAARRLQQGSHTGAGAPAERVATVNGKALPKSEFDLYVANVRAAVRPRSHRRTEGAAARSVHQHAARRRRGRESRRRQGCEGRATSWRWRGCNVMVDAGLQKYLEAHPVTDAELRAGIRRTGRGAAARISRPPHPGRRQGGGRGDHQGAARAAPISPSSRAKRRRTPPARAAAISAGSRSTRWSSRSPTPWRRCSRVSSPSSRCKASSAGT